MKYSSTIALFLIVMTIGAYEARACSCFLFPLEDSFKEADAVFMGKSQRAFELDSQMFRHWSISVELIWKGDPSAETDLVSHSADNIPPLSYCMPDFPVGETFMFFVRKDKEGVYKTIPCSWTFTLPTWKKFVKTREDNRFWTKQGNGRKPKINVVKK